MNVPSIASIASIVLELKIKQCFLVKFWNCEGGLSGNTGNWTTLTKEKTLPFRLLAFCCDFWPTAELMLQKANTITNLKKFFEFAAILVRLLPTLSVLIEENVTHIWKPRWQMQFRFSTTSAKTAFWGFCCSDLLLKKCWLKCEFCFAIEPNWNEQIVILWSWKMATSCK